MAETGRLGAARRAIFCRNDRQNTARIDRIVFNVAVCRAFMRAILLLGIDSRR
jgi:hypothetical protein